MDKLRLVYVPSEDATPDGELSALAVVYAYVIGCHEKKKAESVNNGEGQEAAKDNHAQETLAEKRESQV